MLFRTILPAIVGINKLLVLCGDSINNYFAQGALGG